MQTQIENSENTSIIIIEENQLLGNDNEILRNIVQNSIEQGNKNISIDLSYVKFISSWAVEGFLHVYKMCKNKNVGFNIRNVNAAVNNVISKLKLTEILNII